MEVLAHEIESFFCNILVFGAAVITLIVGSDASALPGGWIVDSTHAPYRIERVCRDGIEVTAVVAKQFKDIGGDKVNLDPPRFYDGEITADFESPANLPLHEEYIKKIGRGKRVHITEAQETSIQYSGEETFLYDTFVMPFIKEMDLGANILLGHSNFYAVANRVEQVEDCFYFDYPANQDHTFTSNEILLPSAETISLGRVSYTVEQLPTTGEVKLNNSTTLAEGDRFTQKVFISGGGELNYITPGLTADAQTIKLSVNGIDRLTNANGHSYNPSISADGSYVSFTSDGDDFTSMSTGGNSQIYRFTMDGRTVEGISLIAGDSNFNQGDSFGNGDSVRSAISPDGQTVSFSSTANDMVKENDFFCYRKEDNNGARDVFTWRRFLMSSESKIERHSMFRQSGFCEPTDLNSDSPSLADDRAGNFEMAFNTFSELSYDNYQDNNGELDIVAYDGFYNEPVYDTANNTPIIVIPTLVVPTIPPIIVPRNGDQAAVAPQATPQAPNAPSLDPDISADGNVIVYESFATDLIRTLSGQPADTNDLVDIYASVRNDADDGWFMRRISLTSDEKATAGGDSRNPTVSMYGNHIAFQSKANNLDPAATTGNWQIFVRDQDAGCTTLLSTHSDSTLGNGDSIDPSISADGRFVAFTSFANNLVDDDTNGFTDIFVIDRDVDETGEFYSDKENCVPSPSRTFRVSITADGTQGDDDSYQPDISLNGEFVAFTSDATTLVADDLNGYSDIFVHYIGYTREIVLTAASEPAFTYAVYLPFVSAP